MNAIRQSAEKSLRTYWAHALLIGVAISALAYAAYLILPARSDWGDSYRPAVLRLLQGHSPYVLTQSAELPFLNAPWVLLPLIPFALLPAQWGRALIFAFSIVCYTLTAIKLGAKPFGLLALLLAYPVIYGLIYGQIDGMLSLGFILPPTLGLFFILAKPQIGIALVIFWLVEAWRVGGWRRVLSTFSPVSLAFALSFALYGSWWSQSGFPLSQNWNTSLWPQSIPIGLALLVVALQQRQRGHAITASPFLSPYLAAHSWAGALLGLLPNTLLVSLASASIWVVWLLGGGPVDR